MNEYRYNDLFIGQSETFRHEVTEDNMRMFRELTGDENPLHMDEGFARSHGFPSRVAYGMLAASLVSAMGGVYLPGKYCLIQQVEVKFVSPVFLGDVLSVCGRVGELSDSVRQAVIKIEMKNQDGRKVVKGKLKVGFLE